MIWTLNVKQLFEKNNNQNHVNQKFTKMSDVAMARLERKIDTLLREIRKKPLWVKASVITSTTIFSNKEKMREARVNGYVQYEKRDDGLWYDLNSVHEKFIK